MLPSLQPTRHTKRCVTGVHVRQTASAHRWRQAMLNQQKRSAVVWTTPASNVMKTATPKRRVRARIPNCETPTPNKQQTLDYQQEHTAIQGHHSTDGNHIHRQTLTALCRPEVCTTGLGITGEVSIKLLRMF